MIAFLIQQPLPVDVTPRDAAQWGLLIVMLIALWRAVYIMRDIYKDFANQSAAERKVCDDRNLATIAVVDAQCNKLAETNNKFSDTIIEMQKMQSSQQDLMRAASERREERLHELVRELNKKP